MILYYIYIINLYYLFVLYSISDQKRGPLHNKSHYPIPQNGQNGKIHSKIVVDAFLRETHSKIVVSGTGPSTGTGIGTDTNQHQAFHSKKSRKNSNIGKFDTSTRIGTGTNQDPAFYYNKKWESCNTGKFDTSTGFGTGRNENETFFSTKKRKSHNAGTFY